MTGYDPDLYALVHRGNPGDRRFYRDLCARAERVLEVGCGTGRILDVLTGAASEVVGLELDPAFAERAAKAAPTAEVVTGDMADLPRCLGAVAEGGFDRIVLPYSVLYCLPSAETQRACLRACGELLRPGGRLAWDGWGADAFHAEMTEAEYPHDELEDLLEVEDADDRWHVQEKSRWVRAAQTVHAAYLYESERGRRHVATLRHRYVLSAEVEALVVGAKLVLDDVTGGFDREPFKPDSPQLIVVASKP